MIAFAGWITSHRKIVLISWLIALVFIGVVSKLVGSSYTEDFQLPASDSEKASALLEDKFPAEAGGTAQVVFKAKDGVTGAQTKQTMEALFDKMSGFPHVSGISSPYQPGGAAAISRNGKIAYATIQFDVFGNDIDKAQTQKMISLARAADGPELQVEMGGAPVQEAEGEGSDTSFAIGLAAAIVVLLLTFGSVVAMGLPIITALFALGVGISLVALITHIFDTSNFAPVLAGMIGLGVGIDYALFLLTRFRHELDQGKTPTEAAIKSVDTAGRAVLFAGTTVIISLLGMLLLGLTFLYGVALAAAVAVLFAMIAALTLLPALLSLAGDRINRLRLPGFSGRDAGLDKNSRWFRWSREIQRRPVMSAILSAGFLLLLCVPALSLRLGTNDAGTEPLSTTSRQAYDLLAEGFGPGFNGPLVMVASLPEKGVDQGLVKLKQALDGDPAVAATTPIILNPTKSTGVFQAYPTASPQSVAASRLLTKVRTGIIPPIEAKTGARMYVGGINAISADFDTAISKKLPLFVGVIIALSALLLMMVFRSLLIPLKAVLMNLLSIGAAFGIIVAVFQWGWGAGLIGVDNTGPIISFLPIFLFAIVFGLSMDYEVFLMSRIHEEWDRTHDESRAVTTGLALTGRVITAAASIMVTVFASFILGDARVIKLAGLGLASAVLIDAVVIRTILVPAIMQLFGDKAWWIPGRLDNILPRLSVEPPENIETAKHPDTVEDASRQEPLGDSTEPLPENT